MKLLTPEETSEFLSISIATLYRMRADRTGPPYIKIGSSVRYSDEDLRAWVAAGTSTAEVPAATLSTLAIAVPRADP